MKSKLNILQVSTFDDHGGASRVAYDLHRSYRARGHNAYLAVGYRCTDDPDVTVLPNDRFRGAWARFWIQMGHLLSPMVGRVKGVGRLRQFLQLTAAQPKRWLSEELGHEYFDFPATQHLMDFIPTVPDLIHCHNLHGDYFDLRVLPSLSQRVPVVLSLHDAWLLSGHCAHSLDCERWKWGCGQCPYPRLYPAVKRDATAFNWKRKQGIYSQSRLYVTTASHWLMNKVRESMLKTAECRVIPYGIDLERFYPGDKFGARRSLGLPNDAKILLFIANDARNNAFKDYRMIEEALLRLDKREKVGDLIFICRGDEIPQKRIGSATCHFVPFEKDPLSVVQYYQAADVYVHAAKVDTFPLVILEALACGLPVVATASGGIVEQIEDLKNGFLIAPGDTSSMADRLELLLTDESLRQRLSGEARRLAEERFSLTNQVEAYLEWYQEILAEAGEKAKAV